MAIPVMEWYKLLKHSNSYHLFLVLGILFYFIQNSTNFNIIMITGNQKSWLFFFGEFYTYVLYLYYFCHTVLTWYSFYACQCSIRFMTFFLLNIYANTFIQMYAYTYPHKLYLYTFAYTYLQYNLLSSSNYQNSSNSTHCEGIYVWAIYLTNYPCLVSS